MIPPYLRVRLAIVRKGRKRQVSGIVSFFVGKISTDLEPRWVRTARSMSLGRRSNLLAFPASVMNFSCVTDGWGNANTRKGRRRWFR